MRIPGLAVLCTSLLLVAGLSAVAQTPPDATTVALASFQKLDAALLPLKSPLYHRADRQKIPGLLADLKRTVDAIRLPDAERGTPKAAALERLQHSIADADAHELAFWSSPAAVGDELPTATADALRLDFAAVRTAFSAVTPAAAIVSGTPLPVNAPRDPRATPDATTRSVARAGTNAQRSISDPNAFFDAEAARGGNVVASNGRGLGPSGVAPVSGPRRADRVVPPSVAVSPVPRVSDLKTGSVPEPEPPPATPSKYKSLYDKASPIAKVSMLSAAATVPFVGPAVLAVAVARPQESRETQLCKEAAGGGLYAKMCGAPYPFSMLGPATAGFMHSLFSLGSLGTIAMSLAIGILIPALTGGIGIVFTIIKALLGIWAFFALKSLLTKLWDIGHDLLMLPSTDPRHWRAAREFGVVAAQLLLAVAATIGGVKLGQSTGMSEGIKAGLTTLQARFAGAGAAATAPSGILAQMREMANSEKPAEPPKTLKPPVEPPPPPPNRFDTHVFKVELTDSVRQKNSFYQPRRITGGGHTAAAIDEAVAAIRAALKEGREMYAKDNAAGKAVADAEPPPAKGTHWSDHEPPFETIKAYRNGVKLIKFPREAFKPRAWKLMDTRAAIDPSYVPGGKSLFPENWSKADIESAASEVQSNPSKTIAESGGRKTLIGDVTRHGQSVRIEVGVSDTGELTTTYPSWNQ